MSMRVLTLKTGCFSEPPVSHKSSLSGLTSLTKIPSVAAKIRIIPVWDRVCRIGFWSIEFLMGYGLVFFSSF
jgi:hypothetical protein